MIQPNELTSAQNAVDSLSEHHPRLEVFATGVRTALIRYRGINRAIEQAAPE